MELTQGVGVCSIAFKERSAVDALRAIAAAGADSVELWGQPPHLPFPVDEAWCADLREQASDLGLSFCALGSYYCPGRHPSYDGHPVTKKNQLTAARALGAPIVRIWPGSAGHVRPPRPRSGNGSTRRFATSPTPPAMPASWWCWSGTSAR